MKSSAQTIPTNLKSEYPCIGDQFKAKIAACFEEQRQRRENPPQPVDDDSVSPWTGLLLGLFVGALAGAYVGHK